MSLAVAPDLVRKKATFFCLLTRVGNGFIRLCCLITGVFFPERGMLIFQPHTNYAFLHFSHMTDPCQLLCKLGKV